MPTFADVISRRGSTRRRAQSDGGGVRGVDTLSAVLVVSLSGLIAVTAAAMALPGQSVSTFAVGLDLVIDAVTALVMIAITALTWVRFRDRGEPAALVQTAAFLVLAIANTIAVALAVGRLDGGVAVAGPLTGHAPLYVSAMAHLLAASLLVVGLGASLRGAPTGSPWVVLWAPVAGLLGMILLVVLFGSSLPSLSSPFIAPNWQQAAPTQAQMPTSTPLFWLISGACAGLFLLAAILSRRLYRRSGSIGDAFFTVGLVFAGFAQLHLALAPGSYPGVVSSGDLLRVGFDVALLLGIEAEAGASLARLRQANHDLERLQDAEVHRSALEERARLARELHDGLSQDLWLAKLKVGRLSSLPMLDEEATSLVDDIGGAIDAGLADARQAVIALRWEGDGETTFDEQLASYVDDFADRTGLRADFVGDPSLPRLNPRAEAELLRIAQEALNNVRRHADATVVRVNTAIDAGWLRLGVVDNGRGFDPALAGDNAFGLLSMRERASLIGGRLTIESRLHDGTRVWVDVPLSGVAALAPVSA